MSMEQKAALAAWVKDTLPRSNVQVAQWLSDQIKLRFDSHSAVIAVLHRLEPVPKGYGGPIRRGRKSVCVTRSCAA